MNDLPRTRKSLLIELGKRSELAWEEFLAIYEKAIVGYCIRRGLQEADARDAAQLVYTALHQRLESWDHSREGSFRAWLFRVARNITVDLIAARTRLAVASGDTSIVTRLMQLSDHRSPANEEEQTVFQTELRKAMFQWAARQVQSEVRSTTWQAFCLSALEGLPAEVVATKLSISIGSVYTAKCRVVKRLQERIATWDSENGEAPE